MGIVNYAVNGTQDYAKASVEENKLLNDTAGFLEDALMELNGQERKVTLNKTELKLLN